MLFVVFKLGPDRFALEAGCIVEILPLVEVKHLPQSALGVAGIFDYRGAVIPVIDLSVLAMGRPAASRLSTRIVIVRYASETGEIHLLGVIAEGATETMRREPRDFAEFGIASSSAPWLGPVTRDARGLVQRIDLKKLLTEPICQILRETVVVR